MCSVLELIFKSATASLLVVGVAIIMYYKRAFKYWENKNLPFLDPSIPFGTMGNVLANKQNLGILYKGHYEALKSQGHKHGGFYFTTLPKYMPAYPEYIKYITQQDFGHFTERGFYHNEKDDPLSATLFALGGEKWRNLRAKLSPAFTPGRLKMMLDTLIHCSKQMQEAMEQFCESRQAVDVKEVMACYTTDVIGSCAFGLDCNSFACPDSEFRKQGRKIFSITSFLRRCKTAFCFFAPNAARWLGLRLFEKDSIDFFTSIVKDMVEFRGSNGGARKDLLQLLIGSNFVKEELTAQVFGFFAAGFETSSTTMTFCLYELASNTTIQNKMRDEITKILKQQNMEITYEAIAEMKYMNQVVEETLRKYPPLPFITRLCVKDYAIPGTDIALEKGIEAVIPILGLHRDSDYFPEPDKFDPERFSDERRGQIAPFTYIPFGEGPRICIGARFGMMQIKVGLAVLLQRFKFSLNEMTKVPFEMEPLSLTLIPTTGIFLNVEKIAERS